MDVPLKNGQSPVSAAPIAETLRDILKNKYQNGPCVSFSSTLDTLSPEFSNKQDS